VLTIALLLEKARGLILNMRKPYLKHWMSGVQRMMRRHIVIYDLFDVVVVPYPFTDKKGIKRRPALICSDAEHFNDQIGHSVMAMITSAKNAPWPLDVPITDLKTAGLPNSSKIRMKLFTLDHRHVIEKIGVLAPKDQKAFIKALQRLIPMI
jgi:mRNA interferase MazF